MYLHIITVIIVGSLKIKFMSQKFVWKLELFNVKNVVFGKIATNSFICAYLSRISNKINKMTDKQQQYERKRKTSAI